MAKKDLKAALRDSLHAEETATADRFARAEGYFAQKESSTKPPPTQKVIRDGFTMPPDDYALIAQIQEKGMEVGIAVTKSEVLRAGLHLLQRIPAAELKQVVMDLEKVKPGRPGGKIK